MDRRSAIRKFLRDLLAAKGDHRPFSDDASLILSGRMQSIEAVEVAVFLEQTFGMDFAEMGFDQERLDTVDLIMELVEQSSKAKP